MSAAKFFDELTCINHPHAKLVGLYIGSRVRDGRYRIKLDLSDLSNWSGLGMIEIASSLKHLEKWEVVEWRYVTPYVALVVILPLRPPSRANRRWEAVMKKTAYHCFYCGADAADIGKLQVDHMHPRSRGGSNDISNLVGACEYCNIRKSNRTVEEYRSSLSSAMVLFYGEARS